MLFFDIAQKIQILEGPGRSKMTQEDLDLYDK